MSVEAPENNQPNLADHPMFSDEPQTMQEAAGRAKLEARQSELHRDLGIDPKAIEAHEASEAQARRAWGEFGNKPKEELKKVGKTAMGQSVQPPKTPETHDNLL